MSWYFLSNLQLVIYVLGVAFLVYAFVKKFVKIEALKGINSLPRFVFLGLSVGSLWFAHFQIEDMKDTARFHEKYGECIDKDVPKSIAYECAEHWSIREWIEENQLEIRRAHNVEACKEAGVSDEVMSRCRLETDRKMTSVEVSAFSEKVESSKRAEIECRPLIDFVDSIDRSWAATCISRAFRNDGVKNMTTFSGVVMSEGKCSFRVGEKNYDVSLKSSGTAGDVRMRINFADCEIYQPAKLYKCWRNTPYGDVEQVCEKFAFK